MNLIPFCGLNLTEFHKLDSSPWREAFEYIRIFLAGGSRGEDFKDHPQPHPPRTLLLTDLILLSMSRSLHVILDFSGSVVIEKISPYIQNNISYFGPTLPRGLWLYKTLFFTTIGNVFVNLNFSGALILEKMIFNSYK
jgi:hypothetical protein